MAAKIRVILALAALSRASPSPGQGFNPPATKHHQNLFEVGRNGELGIDVPIRLDIRKSILIGDNEPSIASEFLWSALICRCADVLEQ
jgi:hypothetical protein